MVIAHSTARALAAAAAIVNMDDGDVNQICGIAALGNLLRIEGWAEAHECTETDLLAVCDLRPRLRQLWQIEDEDRVVAVVNRFLRAADAVPQLERNNSGGYELHAAPSGGGLASRIGVATAMAVADLVHMRELSRLRICAYAGCDNVVVDLSKNRSRQYCEVGCGNRAAVTAYRARKAAAGKGPSRTTQQR